MAILFNLGCKLNQYEGECLSRKFLGEDIVILNTCCVTREAELKSFRKFRSLKKRFPHNEIIATGCTCRLYPQQFDGAARIIDNISRAAVIRDIFPLPQRSRYFLKIQDGCNEKCTYCVVPKVRDRLESKSLESTTREIEWAKANNFREVVIVGANIGLHGIETGSSLEDLVDGLGNVADLPRVRLSSCEPKFINGRLLDRLSKIRSCRHFHVPIQSADDSVLQLMGRGYDAEFLSEKIRLITENFPDAAIGADVIVGFPGEGEREFDHTYRFIERFNFMHLHVFPYSPRPVTEAYALGDKVSAQEKNRRLWRLRDMIKRKNYEFRQAMIGKTFEAIVEKHGSITYCHTDNYVRVAIDGQLAEKELVKIRITRLDNEKTYGSIA